ncbi:MAG: hypothetical protein HY721_22890 [Planctomycetes bacterium]|nr:hypothetical protein [Planctomycetota bacterium]
MGFALFMTPAARGDVVFRDSFDDNVVGGQYTAQNGTLSESGGRLTLTTTGEPIAGSKLLVNLTDLGGQARCHKLVFSTAGQGQDRGTFIEWRWIARDPGGNKFPLMTSRWDANRPPGFPQGIGGGGQFGSETYYTTGKYSYTTKQYKYVYQTIPYSLSYYSYYTTQWDRRTTLVGDEEVQLELYGGTIKYYLFPWQDPPPTETVGFEIVTDLPKFHLEELIIEDLHRASLPAALPWALAALGLGALWAGAALLRRRRRGEV